MSWAERALAALAPQWALRRAQARWALRAYEAARPSRLRNIRRSRTTVDQDLRRGGKTLREQARWLEQNYDLADGALDVLVRSVIGTGLIPEPLVRTRDGELAAEVNDQLAEAHARWARAPEVTGEHDYASMQRLRARTLFRDGECFAQYIQGVRSDGPYLTDIPLALELIDPDAVPIDHYDTRQRIVQGVRKNGWGRPVAYLVAKQDPVLESLLPEYREIPAERMQHLKIIKRLRQTRGVTLFASALERIEDIRDYDESERIAAKIAASMAAYIKRGAPDLYSADAMARDSEGNMVPREHQFRAGMIFDFLQPGEEIGVIDTKRPNPQLGRYRDDQLRAASAGIGAAFSSMARNYEGNYSSRRQEANEQAPHYAVLWAYLVTRAEIPTWQRLVDTLLLTGALRVSRDLDPATLYDVDYSRPATPAIDRQKEVGADANALETFQEALVDVWRRSGKNPADMWRKLEDQRKRLASLRDATPSAAPAATPDPNDDTDDEPEREDAA
ncbi:phage portal protein [Thiococcus pfennigii]|uniref:phage portal protein n=1 Tax=Thiococcus pfennigii TaxID=1057 RepID=UPI0019069465